MKEIKGWSVYSIADGDRDWKIMYEKEIGVLASIPKVCWFAINKEMSELVAIYYVRDEKEDDNTYILRGITLTSEGVLKYSKTYDLLHKDNFKKTIYVGKCLGETYMDIKELRDEIYTLVNS